MLVDELKIGLSSIHPAHSSQHTTPHATGGCYLPCAFIIEKAICPLLKVLSNGLGLLVSLKPCLVLLMEPPTLVLESLGSHILLGGPLSVVENVEQGIGVDA